MNRTRGRGTAALLTLAVLVAAITALVMWLRATAPQPGVEVALDPESFDQEVVTCARLESGTPLDSPVRGRATSGTVLSCPGAFDGLIVTYVGEAVGDVLARDGGSWVLMNDDAYALRDGPLTLGGTPAGTNSGLTVWLPEPLDDLVDQPGRPDVRGDVLHVTGTVRRADPEDGGGLTLRALEARVLAEAVEVEPPVHWRQVGAAAVLGVLAILVLVGERRRR